MDMEISNPNFQIMANHSLEEVVLGDQCSKTYQQIEKKPRPDPETALKCPRCESTNTKFCYYNNYSLSQPRYFCKGCRRYWTKGGSLRNVPVGGGYRKNKKSSKRTQDHQPLTTNPNTTPLLRTLPPPSFSHNHPNDHLTLNFDTLLHNHNPNPNPNPNPNTGFLDILRSGFLENNSSITGPTSLQNLYHGFDGGFMSSGSQESCKAMEGEENKALMGLQWQLGVDLDSGRDHNCWNGGGVGSPWHGLINSSFIG